MLRWFLIALMLVPGAQACSNASGFLDLDFTRPDGCGRMDPSACPPLPEADFPYVAEGTLIWGWESDACSVLVPSATPVHIHLDGLEREATGWLQVDVEPREILIPPQDQWDITDDDVDPNGAYRAQESYSIRVTISLVGEPSSEALAKVAARNGAVQLAMKASANATDTFGANFAMQEFHFDGGTVAEPMEQGNHSVPTLSPVLMLVGLALLGLLRRR